MADSATKEFRICKLKLPTLAAVKSQPKLKLHFDLRSEAAGNAPPLLAALISSVMLRTRGSSGAQWENIIRLQKPGFMPNINNPLNNVAVLFSEIQQELATETRRFSLIQSEYLKECIKRSRYPPTISRTIKTPETANDAISQLRNNVGFLVRLLFEVIEGQKDIQFKESCEIPSLPDIYSTKESKAAFDMPSMLPDRKGKQLTDVASFQNRPHVSGFNSLFNRKV